MAKDFIRSGEVVAFPQSGYDNWWTLLASDDSNHAISIHTDKIDNLVRVLNSIIKVQKEIKKEEEKNNGE